MDSPRRFGGGVLGRLGRRTRAWGDWMFQQWSTYLMAPMVNPDGERAKSQVYAYVLHAALACFSESLLRVAISFVYVMALAQVNGGVINFTAAALAKAFVLGGGMAVMGGISAYGRWENVLGSWWPSSSRMFGRKSIQPYADLLHVVAYGIFQWLGSMLGIAIAMWVANLATINAGQPSQTADVFGLFGTYTVTTSDLWLIEIFGSAILTFAWLMLVVHRNGARHMVYVGVVMGLLDAGISLVCTPASGANFDFAHYAALQTVLHGRHIHTFNYSHVAAFLVGPLIGAPIAVVGYLVVTALGFAGGYARPGMKEGAGYETIGSKLPNGTRKPRVVSFGDTGGPIKNY